MLATMSYTHYAQFTDIGQVTDIAQQSGIMRWKICHSKPLHMLKPLEPVWDRHAHRLRAFIRRRVGDDAEADDILQEVFIRVHRHLCCQPNWDKPESWFYQIARNLVIDHYRRRRELVELSDSLPAAPDLPEADPEAGALAEKDDRRSARALSPGFALDGISGLEPEAAGREPGAISIRREVPCATRPRKTA
jgi:hypothetical protein